MDKYDVYSEFDIQKHKATFVNYLEVVISPEGTVEYAVPSHQNILFRKVMEKEGLEAEEAWDKCLTEARGDVQLWLCEESGYASVWDELVVCYKISRKQVAKLRELKMNGLYKGKIPDTGESGYFSSKWTR